MRFATLPAASRAWTVSVSFWPLRRAVRALRLSVSLIVRLPAATLLRVVWTSVLEPLASLMVRFARSLRVMVAVSLPLRRVVLASLSATLSCGAVRSACVPPGIEPPPDGCVFGVG